jgi:NAD(P)-dependent dehydrogenase (short-subunit alcohol dehydrogenase family)
MALPALFDLTGQTALITGSSRGIGKAIAHRMAEHGANVVISSRKADACEAARDEINAAVGQLDQTTQQNAALVEQSAAAAQSLRAQAARLAESVAGFRLDATSA